MASDLASSKTLRRAARVERDRLRRAQERIVKRRAAIQEELAQLEAEMQAIDERITLLRELDDAQLSQEEESSAAGGRSTQILRGAQIRERAARAFFLSYGPSKAVHYRRWFELLIESGIEIAGKDPAATFLTNLGRSPVVARGPEPGTYEIDAEAPARLRAKLAEMQAELHDLTQVTAREVSPDAKLREHRSKLLSEIRRLEKLLAESERVLAPATENWSAEREAA